MKSSPGLRFARNADGPVRVMNNQRRLELDEAVESVRAAIPITDLSAIMANEVQFVDFL